MKRTLPLFCALLISAVLTGQAVITAIYDADLPGGLPKGTELYILDDITDMSRLGIGSANNGDGTDGVEYAFPAMPVDSGTYVYVTSDSAGFIDFFGFDADFITGAMSINGDDAIELFWDSVVIDVFGDINVDGNGQPWEYTDSWASRKPMTGPDGSSFVLQNWNFGGVAALDGETTNGSAQNPVPLMSYTDTTTTGDPDATVIMQNLQFTPMDITIEVGQTVRWTNVEQFVSHNVNGLQEVYPCNPVGFFSGQPAFGVYDFDFQFNVAGVYNYQCDPHLPTMIGTVTVVDPDAPNYPFYTIGLVHTEDVTGIADSVDAKCALTGIVHGPNFRPGGLQFTLIDVGAGVGINVFKSTSDCYEITDGDMIRVRGRIDQFNGLTEIIPEQQIEVLSSGNALMTEIETDQQIDESMESLLVTVKTITVDSIVSTGASGWNMFGHNDQSNNYIIRLDSDVIPDAAPYEGTILDVTGIIGQFDDSEPYDEGYQIFPRSTGDIKVITSVTYLPEDAIAFYPNPTTGLVQLTTSESIIGIKVVDALGRNVIYARSNLGEIDMSELTPGAYILRVETERGIWVQPCIKL